MHCEASVFYPLNTHSKGNWTTQMRQKVNIVIDGKSIEMPVLESTEGLNVVDVRGLINEGMFTYDPGFLSTASCDSKVTYIDGEKGISSKETVAFLKGIGCELIERAKTQHARMIERRGAVLRHSMHCTESQLEKEGIT